MMNRDSAVLLSVAAGLVISCLCASASVLDTPDKPYAPNNPYKGIVERNLFALKPPPPPPPDPSSIKPPPIKITLQGIDSILGYVQVLFKTPPPPGPVKPGEPPLKEVTYVLGKGESQDDIEVQDINEEARTVRFNNHGVIQTLDLNSDKDSEKSPTGPAPAPPAPGGIAGGPPPLPGAPPAQRTIPPRTLRLPNAAAQGQPMGMPGASANPQPPAAAAPIVIPPSSITREQMEALRNDPEMPPMPMPADDDF